MISKRVLVVAAVALFGVLVERAWALPVFQVYSPGAVAADMGGDEDTWFVSGSSFDLVVVSSFGPNAIQLDDITLIASVPQGQGGTIAVTPSYGPDPSSGTYGERSDFLPAGATFNNHYPFDDAVSDFVVFRLVPDLLTRPAVKTALHNYNADDGGSISPSVAFGFVYTYSVQVRGVTSVHFAVYGYETDLLGKKKQKSTWEINPGSHDVTAVAPPVVPLPAAAWAGAALFGLIGTRRLINRRSVSAV